MKIKIYEIFSLYEAIDSLCKENKKISIQACMKLYRNLKKCKEITDIFLERLIIVFGREKLKDINSMTDNEIEVYNNMFNQEIEIELEKIPAQIFDESVEVGMKHAKYLSYIIL